MSVQATISLLKTNKKTLFKAILSLSAGLSLCFGIITHKENLRLSESLKMAQNNIEAYQDALSGAQQASGVLKLDMQKLSQENDVLVQKVDSMRKELGIKAKEIRVAATLKQIVGVNSSKEVKGDIITILKDTVYRDSILYNKYTKVYYNIGKDSVNIGLDIQNTQYLYIYKHKEYKNKKNFIQRLFTLDWKKKYTYKYKIENTNDLIQSDSIRIIEAI